MYPRTFRPLSRAVLHTGSKRSKDSAMEQLVFRRENDSVAAANTAISCAPAAIAPSSPFMFGTSTG